LYYRENVILNVKESGWLVLTSFPRLVFRNEGRKKQTISINILSSKTRVISDEGNLIIITASGEYSFKMNCNVEDWIVPIKELVNSKKIENAKTSGELLQCKDCGIIYKETVNHIRACLYHPGNIVKMSSGLQWNCCFAVASKYWRYEKGCHLKNHSPTNKPFSSCADPKKFFIF